MKKHMVAILMAALMTFTSLPVSVFAEEADDTFIIEDVLLTDENSEPEEIALESIADDEGEYFLEEDGSEEIIDSGNAGEGVFWQLNTEGELRISGQGDMTGRPWRNLRKQVNTVVVEEGITSIGNYAFEDCVNLSEVYLADGITKISDSAFSHCISLEEIVIPQTVTTIEAHAFRLCTALQTVEIPSGVTEISNQLFDACDALEEVKLDGNITVIGTNAFMDCKSLAAPVLPESLTEIGIGAFRNCESIEEMEIPSSVVHVGNNAFTSSGLKKMSLPDSVTELGNCVFQQCPVLKEVVIGNGTVNCGFDMFDACDQLERIVIGGDICEISDTSFPVGNTNVEIVASHDVIRILRLFIEGEHCHFVSTDDEHEYGNWKTVKLPTCTETGYRERICKVCEVSDVFEMKAKGHKVVVDPAQEATFKTTGLTEGSHCSTCEEVFAQQDIIPVLELKTPVLKAENTRNAVKISWKAVEGADGYLIYKGSSKIATVTADVLSYKDESAAVNGKKATYKVVAYAGSPSVNKVVSGKTSIYYLNRPGISGLTYASSKGMKVSWKANTKASGYQIRYGTDSAEKTITVTGKSAVSKTIKKISKKKTYTVTVRSYKIVDGVKSYSAWSTVKTVKTK